MVIILNVVARYTGNTLHCLYGGDAGCWFLDTGFLKVVILILSSIKHPVSSILPALA